MSTLVFVEGADDELSRQALTLADSLEGDIRAVTVDGPYAPSAWAKAIVSAWLSSSKR